MKSSVLVPTTRGSPSVARWRKGDPAIQSGTSKLPRTMAATSPYSGVTLSIE